MGVQRYLFLPASFLSFIFSTFLSFLLIPCLISSRIQRFLTFFSIRWVLSLSGTQQILIFSLFVGLFRFLAPNDSCFFLFSLGYFASWHPTILDFFSFRWAISLLGTQRFLLFPLFVGLFRFLPTNNSCFYHEILHFSCSSWYKIIPTFDLYHEIPYFSFSSWYTVFQMSSLLP